MIYRDAVLSDMDAVARLHEICFTDTFISSLGTKLISKYYEEYISEGGPFVLAIDGDSLVGLCMGYYSGSVAREAFIKKNVFALALRVIYLCASFNKVAWHKAWSFLLGRMKPRNGGKTDYEADLLSICVRPEYKGRGVSMCLVKEFEKRVVASGRNDLALSVYKTNERAVAFYGKMGYVVGREDVSGYRMYKKLGE